MQSEREAQAAFWCVVVSDIKRDHPYDTYAAPDKAPRAMTQSSTSLRRAAMKAEMNECDNSPAFFVCRRRHDCARSLIGAQ
jgi:hypothetical protein